MPALPPPAVIARLRLAAQWILPAPPAESPANGAAAPAPVDVVRRLTGLQGQDFPGALWSIGLRAPGTTRADVEAAFNRGEIVRSWPLRGTLHVTAAEDLGWILALTAGRVVKGMAARHRGLGIAAADVARAREAAVALLAGDGGGDPGRATRNELFTAFEACGQPTAEQRGQHLLWLLSLEGVLVQGPVAGNGQSFVLAEQWITAPRRLSREEGLAELALRYFRSHGPATLKDFQWWAKLTLADIRTGMDHAAGQLASVGAGDAALWMAPETAALLEGTVPGARSVLLLPGFDEFLLGYTDRGAALAPHHAPLTVPGGNGMFKATVVAGGRVAGTWRTAQGAAEKQRQLAGVVLPELFGQLGPAQAKALAKAAEAYARFRS